MLSDSVGLFIFCRLLNSSMYFSATGLFPQYNSLETYPCCSRL
jgi:hypothetical protein